MKHVLSHRPPISIHTVFTPDASLKTGTPRTDHLSLAPRDLREQRTNVREMHSIIDLPSFKRFHFNQHACELMMLFSTLVVCLASGLQVVGSPGQQTASEPDPSLAFSVVVNGHTFTNKVHLANHSASWDVLNSDDSQGLVAFGLIPSNFRDSTG